MWCVLGVCWACVGRVLGVCLACVVSVGGVLGLGWVFVGCVGACVGCAGRGGEKV